jgi:hypothetical protein
MCRRLDHARLRATAPAGLALAARTLVPPQRRRYNWGDMQSAIVER